MSRGTDRLHWPHGSGTFGHSFECSWNKRHDSICSQFSKVTGQVHNSHSILFWSICLAIIYSILQQRQWKKIHIVSNWAQRQLLSAFWWPLFHGLDKVQLNVQHITVTLYIIYTADCMFNIYNIVYIWHYRTKWGVKWSKSLEHFGFFFNTNLPDI